MTYWAIAPFHNDDPETLRRAWRFDTTNGVIAIGWSIAGEPSGLSKAQITAKLEELYPGQGHHGGRMVWEFYNSIQIGDYVVARQGLRRMLGLGVVTSDAFFDRIKGQQRVDGDSRYKANFRGVRWLDLRERTFDYNVFTRSTVARVGKHLSLFEAVARIA